MGTQGWGTNHSVERLLFQEGHRFDFFQAVKLLEILYPEKISVGEGAPPEKETVRFASKVGIEFPATDISGVNPPKAAEMPAQMDVNFMGLAGCLGPLPMPYTELVLARLWHKDTTLKDFLDIFNHRIISLLYRVRKTHRIGFDFKSPEDSPFAGYLYSLFGMGTEGLQGRMQVKDRTLLYYAALLAHQPRSMTGLVCMLSDYFAVDCKAVPLCGRWLPLEKDQITKIGINGQNQILGDSAVVGARVWDQQGKFEIHLGPLPWKAFLDFLPAGRSYAPACQLIRYYAGTELEFELQLMVKGDEIPVSRLGKAGGPRLGWTSWLNPKKFSAKTGRVKISPDL